MASLGPDAGAKVRDVAGAFRELAKAKIGAGTMAGMKLAAVGLLALGSAAATTAPQMLAVVSAGDAIMDMTGRIIDMEADFDRAAAIMSKFGQRMGEAFDKVATAAEAGPFSAEAETRAETITTVKVKDEVARNAAAGSRQIGDILTSIRDVLTSVDAKMDPATVLDIKKILDANLPAESAKGAPVDDINRWKLG
jgi:hypothetical protein